MMTLHGQGNDAPPVYGRAAQVGEENGRPTLAPELLVIAANHLRRDEEPLDVVLVVEDAAMALWMPLPKGLTLAGVVAESAVPPTGKRDNLPIVSGISEARALIQEGNLLIVDPERGRVLIEPEAEEFARLQDARLQKRRVMLGSGHTPARTHYGRIIEIWASVRDFADVEAAIAAGADGIFVDGSGDILPDPGETDEDPEEVRARLIRLTDTVGGGDIGLFTPFDALDLLDVTEMAACCTLRWAWQASDLPMSPAEFQAELTEIVAQNRDTGVSATLPLLCAAVFQLSDFPADATGHFAEVLLAQASPDDLTPGAAFALPPLRVLLGESLDCLPDAVAAGAVGVIVSPPLVGVAKDMVREQSY